MNKKPIFDAVRQMLDRGFTQAEVDLLDRAIDQAPALANDSSPPEQLGELSERFESDGRGPGAVSGGSGDPGGVSYGIWQLSSRAGTAAAFVAAEGARWRSDLAAGPPGSAAFTAGWKAVAAREPQAFAEAQRAFIARTHYRPAIAAVLHRTGLDLDTRHPAVRDVCWSVVVQHGGAAGILASAVSATEAEVARDSAAFDRRLIEAIYAERSAYVLRVAARSARGARHTLETVARSRYPAELAAALAMFDEARVSA